MFYINDFVRWNRAHSRQPFRVINVFINSDKVIIEDDNGSRYIALFEELEGE